MLSFNTRNDEELLHSSRMGDFAAEQELTERYFRGRFSACKLACPDAMSQLDDWELNDAHFHAFVQAVTSYRFQGVRLFTYYIDVLRNELFDALERKSKERAAMTFYDFDAPMLDGKGNEFTLSDSVSSNEPMDDPHAFLQYAEMLRSIQKLPTGIRPVTLDLVSFVSKGYSLSDAAFHCGLNRDRAKYEIARYRKWAVKTIRSVYSDPQEKEKLLDAFLRCDEE